MSAVTERRRYTSAQGTVRSISEAELQRRFAAGTIRLEGVDSDEAANSVTYWYCPADE